MNNRTLTAATAAVAMLVALCPAAVAETYVVDGNHPKAADQNAGSAEAPFKTIAKGLAAAKAGDTVLVRAGAYPETVSISKSGEPNRPIVLQGAPKEAVTILGGLDANGAAFVRIENLKFTSSEHMKGRKVFVVLRGLKDSEFVGCEIYEKAENSDWVFRAIDVYGCQRTALRDCRIHHVDLGVNLGACKDVVVEGMAIGPWDHEDGMRMMRCDGVLVQNCEIQSEETYRPDSNHPRSGHIDGIQIIRKNDNITMRNLYIHGTAQGIGVFTDSFGTVEGWNEPRKNLRIEGCLILTQNKYQGISLWRVESPVVINNTVPVSRIEVANVTGDKGVVKNNISPVGSVSDKIAEADCNIWFEEFKGGSKTGKNDLLVGTDPAFVNAPTFEEASDYRKAAEFTARKVFLTDLPEGKVIVGDFVELDGDGVPRKVTAVEGKSFEFDPPLAAKPRGSVRVANWKKGNTNYKVDYRLRANSPAIDSADSSVGRGKDRAGNEAFDAPGVENKGAGPKPYLDRGALEYVPEKAAQPAKN